MTWTPIYNATFTKPVVRQLMALVQRDIRAALDYIGGPDVLDSFVTYQFAAYAVPQFPSLLIAPERSVFDQNAVGSSHSTTHYYAAVAIGHQDPNILAELTQDYLRALDYVISSILLSDFQQSWPLVLSEKLPIIQTEPLVHGIQELFVLGHAYDEMRRTRDKFAMIATLDLIIEREEA